MSCPGCGVAMGSRSYEEVEIQLCPSCHGTFLAGGELEKVVALREAHFDAALLKQIRQEVAVPGVPQEEVERVRKCPHCQAGMTPVNYSYASGIILDRCPAGCGVFLDGGELEAVQAYAEHWEDHLSTHRDRYRELITETGRQATRRWQELEQEAVTPSRLPFVNALLRGLLD